MANFLLGPRVSVHKWARVTPYFQTLFGGVYATTSTAVSSWASWTASAGHQSPRDQAANCICDDCRRRIGH